MLLDGRDTAPLVGPKYVKLLQDNIKRIGIGKIITIGGRYYAMNRDRNWDLTEMAYNVIINGQGDIKVNSCEEAFQIEYDSNDTDEFMKPSLLESVPVKDNDSMIMFNFRSDRMIQMLRSLKDPEFSEFDARKIELYLVTMTDYEQNDKYRNLFVAYPPEDLNNTLGEYISKLGLKQLRLSEYEKSGHITFYFSGCSDQIFDLEDRRIFDRVDVFTYDEDPKMRSYDITDYLLDNLSKYDLAVVNYPNGDALGHTGIFPKVIEGVEELDKCLGIIQKNIDLNEYIWIITADHGNCEKMIDSDGTPNKMHTTNLVPFIVVNKNVKLRKETGVLADIAPTILNLMELEIPKEMTGRVLIGE